MKKFYSLFFAICFIAVTAIAQDLTIPKFSEGATPVIDGVVDDVWDQIDPTYIEIEDPDDFGPATINEAWFKMGWNDTSLFMLLHRNDDEFADQWMTGIDDWQSDRDEIFIDVHVDTLNDGRGASDAQGAGTGAEYGHYQL